MRGILNNDAVHELEVELGGLGCGIGEVGGGLLGAGSGLGKAGGGQDGAGGGLGRSRGLDECFALM